MQGTVEDGCKQGQQQKSWSSNIKEWIDMTMPELLRAITNRSSWRKLSVSSTLKSCPTFDWGIKRLMMMNEIKIKKEIIQGWMIKLNSIFPNLIFSVFFMLWDTKSPKLLLAVFHMIFTFMREIIKTMKLILQFLQTLDVIQNKVYCCKVYTFYFI